MRVKVYSLETNQSKLWRIHSSLNT